MATILVVDDIEGVHEMLDIVFDGTGYQLEHALSADEGIKGYKEKAIDAVLTDIQMPGGDGLRMLAELKQLDPDVVAIVTTASESREFVIQALRLGAFDFVQKPYDEDMLLESVNRAVVESERRKSLSAVGGADAIEEIERLRLELAEREQALQAARDKDEEINRLQQELQMREERDIELRKRQIELEAKEGAMKTMETVIQERLSQLSEIQGTGGGSGLSVEEEQELRRLKDELEAREESIHEMELTLQEREANIMENEESLLEKGQRLIEMETELEQIREDLEKKGLNLDDGEELSEEQKAEFDAMQAEIRKKEAALLEMEEQISDRERALKKSEMLIKAREQYLEQTEKIMFGEEKSRA